jgi:hypothetical protein
MRDSKHGEQPRTIEQFMDDQVRFEHRRYENLKSAIIKEEAQEVNSFQP